jgi:hypothetical protein
MILLFSLMLGGYAFGAAGAVLSPDARAARRWAAIRARAIQSGSAPAYLTYLVIALLGLLAMLLARGT